MDRVLERRKAAYATLTPGPTARTTRAATTVALAVPYRALHDRCKLFAEWRLHQGPLRLHLELERRPLPVPCAEAASSWSFGLRRVAKHLQLGWFDLS